jgi:RNA polymerase sigma-70 factor (family 1)
LNDYTTYSDEQLLALLPLSDEEAFTEIYDRYWKILYSLAYSRLKDHFIAEETVQDVFMDIWKRKQTINILSDIKIYLATAVKYRVINAQIRNKYINHDFLSEKQADNTLTNHLDFTELQEQLSHYVNTLPERCRLVYKMSREEGLNNKLIALKMNISEKAVEHQVTRALKSLRANLQNIFSSFLSL